MNKRNSFKPICLIFSLFAFSLCLAGCGGPSGNESTSEAPLTFKVTWKNEDGTVLEVDERVEKGTMPSYDGATPRKEGDDDFVYSFAGWNPALARVERDTVYTATFAKSERPSVETMIESDKKLFAEHGYQVSFAGKEQSFIIDSAESNFGVEKGSVAGVLGAEKKSSDRYIEVYYFYKMSVAKDCYENTLPAFVSRQFNRSMDQYFLLENRIYSDATKVDFFEEIEHDDPQGGTSSESSSSEAVDSGSVGSTSSSSHLNTIDDDAAAGLSDEQLYALLSDDWDLIKTLDESYYIGAEYGRSVYLDSYCPGMGIERNDLYGILTATSMIDEGRIEVHYFYSASLAKKYFDQLWSTKSYYSNRSVKVIFDNEQKGIIQ